MALGERRPRILPLLGAILLAGESMALAYTDPEIDLALEEASRARLRGIVRRLGKDEFAGRDNGTVGSQRARRYLTAQLEKLGPGLNGTASGDEAYAQPFLLDGEPGTNLLAVIPGREIPNRYVVVGAHYDGLGGACTSSVAGDTVCNGATDNATGVAAALAIGEAIRALPVPPRRSVVIALWDAEEDGLVGSLHYARDEPLVPLSQTIAYVNLDIQGANLLPSLRDTSFAVGAETGGRRLRNAVSRAAATEGLGTRLLSSIFGQFRSDYVNFQTRGVPIVFFSDSTGGCYHTAQDELGVVDFEKLVKQTRIAARVVVSLAESAGRPRFTTQPTFATYADAQVIDHVFTSGLDDQALFAPAGQTELQSLQAGVRAMVDAGPDEFGSDDVQSLLLSTIDAVDLLGGLPCDGFLPE